IQHAYEHDPIRSDYRSSKEVTITSSMRRQAPPAVGYAPLPKALAYAYAYCSLSPNGPHPCRQRLALMRQRLAQLAGVDEMLQDIGGYRSAGCIALNHELDLGVYDVRLVPYVKFKQLLVKLGY